MRKERIGENLRQEHRKTIRVNRILSLSGMCSRRKADEWILAGRVKVNDRILRQPGVRALWGEDSIKVDEREIPRPSDRIYLMLNKPFGYICALSDPQGRPLVIDLLSDINRRVYPVGRLDFDSLGLLLLTDDGELAHRLTHPRYHVPKTYKITLKGMISGDVLTSLREGIRLEDGFSGRGKVSLLERNDNRTILRMTITTGKNRLLRRMLNRLGHDVVHLVRTAFGPVGLGDLKIGAYRNLDNTEIDSLKKMVGMV